MTIAQSLLPEFDEEMKTTRTLLERLPEEKAKWKPHAKSFSLGDLAMHLVNTVEWMPMTLTSTEYDFAPPGGGGWKQRFFTTRESLLAEFDDFVKKSRAALVASSDADLQLVWTLKSGGKSIFATPRLTCIRSFVLNHLIHHRGQFSVYLRLCDVPLPWIYGPTADTPG
jgi:uncharacterized damage-inducible protein DinB